MRVVDTNFLASVLIDGPFSADARTLLARDADWHSEAFILVELSNVVLTQVRARRCTLSVALHALALGTATLHGRLHDVAHADARPLPTVMPCRRTTPVTSRWPNCCTSV